MDTALRQEQILTIVEAARAAYPELEAVYLYGSAACGTLGENSDVDLALLLPAARATAERAIGRSDLRFHLEQTLGRTVDLVNARTVSTVLQKEILASGTAVFVGDRRALDEYEMLVLSRYGKLNEERRGIVEDFIATGKAYDV